VEKVRQILEGKQQQPGEISFPVEEDPYEGL